MKLFIFTFSFVFISFNAFCGWININSGINDDFTSISFKNNIGLITGKKGVYISTNGGTTSGSWSRAENYLSPTDSIIYNHSQFYSSKEAAYYSTNIIYFCGKDTVNATGVIFSFNTITNVIQLVHVGGSQFNKLANNTVNRIYAVGNNGMLLYFNEANPVVNIVTTNFSFDLKSIDVSVNALVIGTDDYLINGVISGSPSAISFTQSYYPNRNFKDIKYVYSSSTTGYGVGKNLLRFQNNLVEEPHQYYADSLMANSVTGSSSYIFIGTDHGIYRSFGTTNMLEFQPSSNGYHIQSICALFGSLIACGDNGVILYTNDSGGTPEPYAQIDYNGACLNSPQSIASTKGSVTNCSTYIDNVLTSSNCYNFNHTFTTLGTHEIRLVVSNGFYSKTITKLISIVQPPSDLFTNLADDTLCKQEVLDITLMNSENGITYSLYQSGSNAYYGSSASGNGSNLNFQTNPLNQSGIYYIRAMNNLANCSRILTSTLSIVVEQPNADFHFDIINAETNENVRFYQQCTGATNYEWQFSNTPAFISSSLPNVTNSFADLGSTQITLIAGTDNNCYDTTTISGPFIYQIYNDTSWLMMHSKIPGTVNNPIYGEDIRKTIKYGSGYLVAGNYLNRVIESRTGNSLSLSGYGGYLAKYNELGILKWCIKTDPLTNSNYQIEFVSDVTADANGNIYLIGKTPSNGMIDNRGDTMCSNQAFILKLDSLGNAIWNRTMPYSTGDPIHINHDYDNSIYVTTFFATNPTQVFPFMLNGLTTDSLRFTEIACQTCNHQYKVIKIDESGQMEYDFLIEISSSNSYEPPHVVFDTLNNLYLWGSKELYGVIHAPITGTIVQLYMTSSIFGGKMYLSKFDSNGNYQWKVQGYVQNTPNDNTEVLAVATDGAGNLYLTGKNDFDHPANPHIIVNADNSQSSFYGGGYFVAKINSDGMTQWINGNYSSEYGVGFDILLENDTLYTVGLARTYNNANLQFDIIGENTSVPVYSSPYNYFIAAYDTAGTILSTHLNGPSNLISGAYMDLESFPNLIRLNDGYFLLNKNVRSTLFAPDTAIDFGFELPPSGFQDGTQLKLKLDQGVEFLPHYYKEFNYSVCYGDSFTYPDGTGLPNVFSHTLRIDSLVAANGTDSIIKYQVFVNPDYTTTTDLTVCKGSDVVLGDGTTIHNIQNSTSVEMALQSISGCDSTVIVSIHVLTINAQITQFSTHLAVPNTSTSYQWAYCDSNFLYVPNQQNYIFAPSEDGNYAVIITLNGCIDTSDCYSFDYYSNLSLNESSSNSISIAPNPTSSKSLINFEQAIQSANLSVYSSEGRKIIESRIDGVEQYELDLSPFEKGTYFVRITIDNEKTSTFIIVKN